MSKEESKVESGVFSVEKALELVEQASKDKRLTVRDDLFEFPVLLDAARICRKRGGRLRLIDTGKFDFFHLEWLGKAGMDFYTGSDRRTDLVKLNYINEACKKSGGTVFYFIKGPLKEDETEAKEDTLSFSDLKDMRRMGIDLHLSSREKAWDLSKLKELAESLKKRCSELVYYHHGKFDKDLIGLASKGVWIHLSGDSLDQDEKDTELFDTLCAAGNAAKRLIFHIENLPDPSLLVFLLKAGAHLLFKNRLFDYRSPYRPIVRAAEKKRLSERAYYLYSMILL
ncbi:MAG: hypothetical protein JXB26_10460 [Candidatus Aminicenantes bacterium]|nr:hypothetical protein [Candidatus Aminicenantes bacterium]